MTENKKKFNIYTNFTAKKLIFIAYSHRDKIIARLVYHQLIKEYWKGIEIFLDEFSIKPGKNIKKECVKKIKNADLGIVILSKYTKESEYVPQEVGILLAREIPKIYISIYDDIVAPLGYENSVKTFPLYEEKDPFKGLIKIKELVKEYINPSEIGAIELVNKGVSLANQCNFKDAIEHYERAIIIDPVYDIPYFNKISCLRKLGRYNEAIQFANYALAKFPKHIDILSRKAFVFYSLKKYEEAIETYDRILSFDKININAKYYKAECLRNQKKFRKALELYTFVKKNSSQSKFRKKATRKIILLKKD